MTPWEDLFFVINNLLLGEEPVRSCWEKRVTLLYFMFPVNWGLHSACGDQRCLRSLHSVVLLSNRAKGQPGRVWAPLNTGRAQRTPTSTSTSTSTPFQTADAVYDAKYKQLAQSPGCRKPGLQDLMQYEMNTWYSRALSVVLDVVQTNKLHQQVFTFLNSSNEASEWQRKLLPYIIHAQTRPKKYYKLRNLYLY